MGTKKNKQQNPNRAEQITHSVAGRPLEGSHNISFCFWSGHTARIAAHNPRGLAAADASLLLGPSFLLNVVHAHHDQKGPPFDAPPSLTSGHPHTHTFSTPRDPRSGAVPDLGVRTALLRTTPHKWHATRMRGPENGEVCDWERKSPHPSPGCVIHFLPEGARRFPKG
jgi:hypothetical protein